VRSSWPRRTRPGTRPGRTYFRTWLPRWWCSLQTVGRKRGKLYAGVHPAKNFVRRPIPVTGRKSGTRS